MNLPDEPSWWHCWTVLCMWQISLGRRPASVCWVKYVPLPARTPKMLRKETIVKSDFLAFYEPFIRHPSNLRYRLCSLLLLLQSLPTWGIQEWEEKFFALTVSRMHRILLSNMFNHLFFTYTFKKLKKPLKLSCCSFFLSKDVILEDEKCKTPLIVTYGFQ